MALLPSAQLGVDSGRGVSQMKVESAGTKQSNGDSNATAHSEDKLRYLRRGDLQT